MQSSREEVRRAFEVLLANPKYDTGEMEMFLDNLCVILNTEITRMIFAVERELRDKMTREDDERRAALGVREKLLVSQMDRLAERMEFVDKRTDKIWALLQEKKKPASVRKTTKKK